jgi:hypothetical protein
VLVILEIILLCIHVKDLWNEWCYFASVKLVHGAKLLKIDVGVCLVKFVLEVNRGAHLLHWK